MEQKLPVWADKHYAFFRNEACEYFPCHDGVAAENFNCLFCYCPLYALGTACGGNFTLQPNGSKDCRGCAFPHRRENYGAVLDRYPEILKLLQKNGLEQPE